MPQRNEYYPAKLLLFGEYTILSGSQALAVPLNRWQGKWVKEGDATQLSVEGLDKFLIWLETQNLIDPELSLSITTDFEKGWNYRSDIPRGYGIGSSGALVAAMYDRYFSSSGNMEEAQAAMAKMEAYFHGASSGLDPLISYTGKAVYKDEVGCYHSMEDPGWPADYKLYFLDAGNSRETGPLVNRYMMLSQDHEFAERINRFFIPMVEHAIHFYLERENKLLEECINLISQFQQEYFKDMIPGHVKKQWDELVSKPGVYVKLCGAGGGGYFLVISTGSCGDLISADLIALN